MQLALLRLITPRSLPLLAGVGALSLALGGTGCLEASQATTDSGAANPDTGATHKSDSGTSASPDATSGGHDASKGGDSSMTTPGTDATSPSDAGATCKNPTAPQETCASCEQSQCLSTVTTEVSACSGSFATCFEMCDCSNTSCITTCAETEASSACQSALGALASCQTGICKTACTADAGTGTDAGPPTDAGATCKNPTETQDNCAACEESSCASVVSTEQSACSGFFTTCFDACDCTDTSCITACAENASTPSACQNALGALANCQTGMCKSACSADAGTTTKDGGSISGQIPDCANPTSAEQMLYTACSACDHTSCSTYVTTAVSDCTAFYACYAQCDCSDTACQTTCESQITVACDTAIGTLTDCQDTFCAASCD
jgi:hypothetical protein